MRAFVVTTNPSRIVFGPGTVADLPDEVDRRGARRVLLLGGAGVAAAVDRAAALLGPRLAGRFDGVRMHTPVDVTEQAVAVGRDAGADCVVAIGGGSTTGLGKAITLRTGWPLIVVATTYAGSEVTPILGETAAGEKSTQTTPAVLPGTVIYDVELTLDLPIPLSVTSGVNAMAHAVEALYAPQSNPATDALAVEALSRMSAALPRIANDPSDVDARGDALLGAWLAGICLGTVGMGLHHRLCHILGGTYGLPHAETHTVVLPHVMAYNAPAAPVALGKAANALGVPDAAAGVFDLITALGGPTTLAELGFPDDGTQPVAQAAVATPPATNRAQAAGPRWRSAPRAHSYPNPRPVTVDGVTELLRAAQTGERPIGDSGRLTREVTRSFAGAPARLRTLLTGLVEHLHAYARENEVTIEEWGHAIDFLTRTGHMSSPTRQEFILLSDTLGVSSLVDQLASARNPTATPSAVLGPFYVESPPTAAAGADIAAGQPGVPLWTDVSILDTEGQPVAGATVDIWQSDEDGFYDVQRSDLTGPALRARLTSDEAGRVRFWSILPSEYPIPTDGPVGQLLRTSGRHAYRAPHLHFLIRADGYRELVTQLFVAGGAYLDSDAVFGVKPELIVDFPLGDGAPPPGRTVGGAWRQLHYTFHIAREPRI